MSRMLNDLKEIIDDIDDDWAREFIESVAIQKEEKPGEPLTGKQLGKIDELHGQYIRQGKFKKWR